IAVLGGAVGVTESAFLGILASVGVAIAGKGEGAVKLPFVAVDNLAIPTLLWIGVGLALSTLVIQFLITITLARITMQVNTGLRRSLYEDFSHTSWRVQRSEVESTFVNFIVFHTQRVSNLVTALIGQLVALVTLLVFVVGAVLISPVISMVVIVFGALLYAAFLPMRGIARTAGDDAKAATRNLSR